jgi:PTH1 family peptidyl-tRNA hydrolase
VKVVCGLGNPGPEYHATRHNVGWWALERLRRAWGFPELRARGAARFSDGERAGDVVVLVQPLTYMNRSGGVLGPLTRLEGFEVGRDLLVLVDDVNLEVGRLRLRGSGSAGGHNGLRSVEAALGTREYARLRIGVGARPAGTSLSDWVLSPMPPAEEEAVLARLPDAVSCVEAWLEQDVEAAMQRCNH